jgi:DNA-binding response OmpR family regulator
VVEDVDVRILPHARQVLVRDVPVDLTRLEFELLLHLCEHPDRVHRRRELLSAVWEVDDVYSGARTVDVHVRRVRQKLGDAADVIQTVRGVGYLVASNGRVRVERSQNVVRLADRRAG